MNSFHKISFYGYEMTYMEYLDFIETYYRKNLFPQMDSSAKDTFEKSIESLKKDPSDEIINLYHSIWGDEENSSIKAFGCAIVHYEYNYDIVHATFYIGMYSENVDFLEDYRIICTIVRNVVVGEIETPLDAKAAFEQYYLQGYKQPKSLLMNIRMY